MEISEEIVQFNNKVSILRELDELETVEWLSGLSQQKTIRNAAALDGVPFVYPIAPRMMYLGSLYIYLPIGDQMIKSTIVETLPVPDTQTRTSYEICIAMFEQRQKIRNQYKKRFTG